MLAGLNALFPRRFAGFRGQLRAVIIAAVLFGLGHTAQGWGAVGITAILGVGLGAIMVWHRSIWDAVIAHGFFDASTFLFLYWMAKYRPDLLHGG
jgi:membrane protease YdiL (CAAX protease family)